MDKDAHERLLISDEYYSNDSDSNIEAEYQISTTEVEIINYDESVTLIREEEEAQIFLEGERLVQNTNEVIYMFPEEKYDEVLRSAESGTRRENAGAGIDQLVISFDGNT